MAHILTLSGYTLYANGQPAPDVEVRVFDRDKPAAGNADDELSLQAAVTDANGYFQAVFDTRKNAEFADLLTPYVQFKYRINGVERRFSRDLSFVPFFQRAIELGRILLPEYPPLEFDPLRHGFHFANHFSGVPLPFDIPLLSVAGQSHGLCGGMCFGAADFVVFGRPIPPNRQTPRKGSALYNFLYGRLLDSFGPALANVFKLQTWLSRPSGSANGLQRLTWDEFSRLRVKLDMRQLVSLFVMLDRRALWNSHHVLAYGYVEHANGVIDLRVYDPNYPDDDQVAIRCLPVDVAADGQAAITGLMCEVIHLSQAGRRIYADCFGFFDAAYSPKPLPPRF